MTIGNAKKFIKQALTDADFRSQLNSAADAEARQSILNEKGLRFDSNDFEDALRNELLNCQTETAADTLRQIRLWWQLLDQPQ